MLDHLRSRHVEFARYRTISYDQSVVTFICYNFSGQCVGYQQYRPDAPKTKSNDEKYGRYYTYFTPGQTAVWGLETFYYREDVLFVTEGVFDCVRLHNLGLPAIAVLSCNPKHLRSFLRVVNRKKVAVCDNDQAGQLLANSCDSSMICPIEGMDLGDMTDEQVRDFMKGYLTY